MDELWVRLVLLWNDFVIGYCKVDVVCWAGEPNWLGWLILIFGVLYILRSMLRTIIRKD